MHKVQSTNPIQTLCFWITSEKQTGLPARAKLIYRGRFLIPGSVASQVYFQRCLMYVTKVKKS